jgi:hypothetical protein
MWGIPKQEGVTFRCVPGAVLESIPPLLGKFCPSVCFISQPVYRISMKLRVWESALKVVMNFSLARTDPMQVELPPFHLTQPGDIGFTPGGGYI